MKVTSKTNEWINSFLIFFKEYEMKNRYIKMKNGGVWEEWWVVGNYDDTIATDNIMIAKRFYDKDGNKSGDEAKLINPRTLYDDIQDGKIFLISEWALRDGKQIEWLNSLANHGHVLPRTVLQKGSYNRSERNELNQLRELYKNYKPSGTEAKDGWIYKPDKSFINPVKSKWVNNIFGGKDVSVTNPKGNIQIFETYDNTTIENITIKQIK